MLRTLITALFLVCTATLGLAQQYTLQPGDTIAVEVLEDPSLNRSVLVLPDGNINFPFAGALRAEGRTVVQIQSSIAAALEPNFASRPTVFASLTGVPPSNALHGSDSITVYFLGEVNTQGPAILDSGTTLLQALAQSGGLTNFAAKKRLQLRRLDTSGQEVIYTFDYNAISKGAQVTGTTVVADGDVILVPQRGLFE